MIQIKTNEKQEIIATYYGDDKKKGWTEIKEYPEPTYKEGYYPLAYYRNGKVEYEYEKVEIPPIIENPPTEEEIAKQEQEQYEQRVDNKIREKYSLSNELAILRQRDTKSLEFSMYNDYCEQCKREVKKEIEQEKIEMEQMK